MSESALRQFALRIFEKEKIEGAFEEPIGYGGEARVYVGYLPEVLRKQIAFKLFHKVEPYSREIENLKKLDHPNIIKILAMVVQNRGRTKEPCGYLMEYMKGGSLHSLALEKNVSYDFRPIYIWIEEISNGLLYLHTKKIFHRDLNPNNILLAQEFSLSDPTTWTIRISDFGMARSIFSGPITRGVGTVLYRAPEVSETRYGPEADVFSLTMTIWVMMFRREPYPTNIITGNYLIDLIRNGLRPKIEGEVADGMVDIELNKFFIRGWSENKAHRPGLLDINNFAKARQQNSRSPFILTELPEIQLNLAEISEFERREIDELRIPSSDYEIYKKTVYAEGHDQSTKIRQAIAFVIKNRRDNNAWYGGSTFEGVCRHRGQFSSWNGRDSIQIIKQEIFAEIGSWLPLILKGEIEDPTFGADYFHSRIQDPNTNHFMHLVYTVRIEEIDFYSNLNRMITVPMSGREEGRVVPQRGEESSDEWANFPNF